ncbi:MAG: serine/threonine-protein kinase [Planctomycetota bacterium]
MLASPTLQAVRVLLWQTGRAVPEEQLLRVWRELCAETPAPAAVDFLAALRAQELLSGTLLDCEQVRLLASTTVAPPPGDPALAETTVAPPPGDPALAETTVAPPPGPDTETATQVAPSGADVPDTSGLAEGSSGGWSYELVEAIGQGGMGTVYLALDRNLLRQTAVKRLRDERQPGARARFVYEAQVMSQLDHPNVLPAYALRLEDDGTPSVALKLVRGRTLQDLIGEHQRWGPTRARKHLAERIEVLIKVCEGVGYAHARGVIHRDLKPANVMLGDHGEVYVVDWGLCKLREQTELPHVDAAAPQSSAALDQTLRGQLKGTPLYFSPEQAAGDPEAIGPASDQYALGLILYELLALRFAYEPTSLPALVEQAQGARLRPVPAELGVHPDARAIVAKATALRPEDRYASVLEFAADLRRFLRQEATLARPDTPARAARRWLGRHAGGVVAALALALVALVALSVIRSATAAAAEQAAANRRQAARLRLDARAARLSHHFLGYARELEGLASAAEQLIAGEPWQGALYTRASPTRATAPRPHDVPDYRAPISPSWPLCEGPAGADPARLEAEARRLLAVRPRLLDVFRGVSEGAPRQGPLRPGTRWSGPTPCSESTGLIVLLPGSAGPAGRRASTFAACRPTRTRWPRLGPGRR